MRWTLLCLLASKLAVPSAAWGVESGDTMGAGCNEIGATGVYRVVKDGTVQEVVVYESDCETAANCDGIPDKAWCPGAPTPTDISGMGTSTCGGLVTLSTTECAFDIDIWFGSSSGDNHMGGPVDCTGNANPVMMFGGGGDDILKGSGKGDLLHGGDGNDKLEGGAGRDYLCGGPSTSTTEVLKGQNGADFVWGGPGDDESYGGDGDDLVAGGGDAGDDDVNGGDGDDSTQCESGDGNDSCSGGDGEDVVHSAKGASTVNGDADDDVLLTQNLETDTTIDGGSGTDACWVDANTNLGSDDDTSSNCTNTDVDPCEIAYWVGTNDGTDAWLYKLDSVGDRAEAKGRLDDGTGTFADEVVALAVDPTDCKLWAVILIGTDQEYVTIPASEPAGAGDPDEYDYDYEADVVGDDLVGIAFGKRGGLIALETDAELKVIDKADGTETFVTEMGRGGANNTGVYLTFDGPDSANVVAMTDPDAAGKYSVDLYDAKSGLTRNLEHGIDWVDGPLPFTVVQTTLSGQFLEIDDTPGAGGTYPMWTRGRRNFGGECSGACTSGGAAVDARVEYTPAPLTCTTPTPDQCFADLDEAPDAIAAPHFAQ